tara:strand:- start:3458 stop:3961 length:504 start_codon:yes stop_codon:yes gene_type:complete
MIRNLFLVLLLLYTPVAYAQAEGMEELAEELLEEPDSPGLLDMDFRLDLRLEVLDLGMEAPFSGILFTTDALTKMQLDHKEELALLQNERDYMEQKFNLEIQATLASWQNERTLYAAELNAKRNYIEQLEEKTLETSDWTPVYIVSSFVVGAITTIAITYALKPATE